MGFRHNYGFPGPQGRPFSFAPPQGWGGTEGSPTSGGNISYGFAGTAANDASDGDTAWTNPGNAGPSDDSLATVTLNNNESQWLKITNFDLGGPISSIPAGASINGIEFHIECSTTTNTPYLADLAIVKGGVIGSSLTPSTYSADTLIGQDVIRGLMIGGPAELFGDTFSVSDMGSGFGLAIRVASTGTETVSVDGIRVQVRWAKPAACTVTLDHATSPMAKCYIGFDCLQTYIGDASWEKVTPIWTITGPAGWGQHTVTDPRPGRWGSSRSRSMKTDFAGFNGAIYADAAGTYTFTVTMHLTLDGTKTTITANDSVTVAADTRTVRYLDPGNGDNGDDGTTTGTAWNTWEYAISQLSDNYRLVVAGDTTETVSTAGSNRSFSSLTNVVVEWDGAGAKPIITASTNTVTVLGFSSCTDFVFDGIDMRGKSTAEANVLEAGSNVTRFVMANCEASQGHASFWEMTSGQYARGFLCLNTTISDIHRYGFYLEGDSSYLVSNIGVTFETSTSNVPTGEGHVRFNPNKSDSQYGYGYAHAWCSHDDGSDSDDRHSAVRGSACFTYVHQTNYGNANFRNAGAPTNSDIYLTVVKVIDGPYASVSDDSIRCDPVERFSYTNVRNAVFETSETGTSYFAGPIGHRHYRDCSYLFILFLKTGSGASRWPRVERDLNDTAAATVARFNVVGIMVASAAAADNSGLYDRPALIGGSGSILENGGGFTDCAMSPGSSSADGQWRVGSTYYDDPAVVNALGTVSGAGVPTKDVGGAGLLAADFPSSNSFAPTSGVSTEYEEWAAPTEGVHMDYEGTLRDHTASTWAAGPTIIS